MNILQKATKNLKNILITNYKIEKNTKVLIIFDEESTLSSILKEASKLALEALQTDFAVSKGLGIISEKNSLKLKNQFNILDFYSKNQDNIVEQIEENYSKGDIIISIQSTSFRVSKYRWRNILCQKGYKVLEFGQLYKVKEDEIERFVNSLTSDFEHYEKIADKLVNKIEKSKEIKIISMDGSVLKYDGRMDKCLRNIGELWDQTNWTTRFPIGEVISESLELNTLNGDFLIYAYPDTIDVETKFVKPSFRVTIKNGLLVSHEGPKEFDDLIKLIKTENKEGDVFVRELGLGLNRNIKRFNMISEPMAYERVEGLHFSLGMKHGMYQKKLWPKYGKKFYQKFHIDVFVDVKEILIDDIKVFDVEKGYF